jgi:hypothetical protein
MPISVPSSIEEFRLTAIEPRCTSVTEYPSFVWIATVRPFVGSEPAKEIVPSRGASTGSPASPPMSTPRCCPLAYRLSPRLNGRSTGPETGQLHARAAGATTSERRMTAPVRERDNTGTMLGRGLPRCQLWLHYCHKELS